MGEHSVNIRDIRMSVEASQMVVITPPAASSGSVASGVQAERAEGRVFKAVL